MQIIETAIPEVKILVPELFGDERGYFFESWNEKKYRACGIECAWIQDNESLSSRGVLRGLHYQLAPYTQAKLVRVIEGKVLDVTLDIRKGSPTFGKHIAVELSSENKRQLFIPRGFAHGFVVLSEKALFSYKCDNGYMPSHERGIAFDDPDLGINWPIPPQELILSERDKQHPSFKKAELFDFDSREYLK